MKRTGYLFALLLLLIGQYTKGQHLFTREPRDAVWLFGHSSFSSDSIFGGSRIDFNFEPPYIYSDHRAMNFEAANASICNADGELLFYSNGVYIANHLHQPMENGMGLSPTPFTAQWANNGIIFPQAVLALPQTGNRYLLLHSPIDRRSTPNEHGELLFCAEQLYSTIDMDGNGGLGVVVEKNRVIIPDTIDVHGKLTAVRHANGRDWWAIIPAYYSNRYYRLLITPDTILNLGLQAIGDTIPSGLGQAVFSPDGTKYARLNLYQLGGDQYIDLYDFDRCSGLLSNPRHFTYRDTAIVGGLAFSENSRFLYVSSFGYLYQLDTEQEDVFSTFTLIGRPETQSYFLNQLAPDGKIYVSSGSIRYLHRIDRPNKRGKECELIQQGVQLPHLNFRTMPNHPYYGLGPWDGSPCDTLGIDNPVPRAAFEYTADSITTGVEFFDGSFFASAWVWDMGDGHSYTARHPVHVYAQAGLYTVCLTASNLTGSHTVCDTVRVEVVSSGGEVAGARVELRLFPNPAQARLTVLFQPGAAQYLQLADAMGRTRWYLDVSTGIGDSGEVSIDVSRLAPGYYYFLLRDINGHVHSRGLSIIR